MLNVGSEEERLQGGGNLQETCSIKESTTESASSSGKNDAESESPSNLRSYVKQQKTSKFSRIVSAEERTAFTKAVMALMHSSGKWTFAKYRAYIQALMKEQGTDTVKHRLLSKYFSQSDEFKLMEQKLTVLETFTPTELKGTSWTQFSFEDRLLIAEAAKVPPNFVLQMLYEFDQLKTDRSWYLRRMALGRPLPNSRIEREWMAECDRMVYNKIRGKMMPLETFIGRCQEKNPGKMPRYEIFRLTGKGRRGRPSLWGDAKQQYTRKCIVKRQKTFSTSPVPRTWLGSLKNVKIKKPFRF